MSGNFGTLIPMHKLDFYGVSVKKLGSGAFGDVYEYVKSGVRYAVKSYIQRDEVAVMFGIEPDEDAEADEPIRIDAVREIGILQKLSHPNIIQLIDVIDFDARKVKGSLKIVLPWADYSLDDYITGSKFQDVKFSNKTLKSYMYQLLRGLKYLHSNNVWHRDIKPSNILVYRNIVLDKVVFADFGVSRFGTMVSNDYSKGLGTLYWRAPELFFEKDTYGSGVDIFALGTTFADMLLKRYIFEGSDEKEVLMNEVRLLGGARERDWPGISSFKEYDVDIASLAEEV